MEALPRAVSYVCLGTVFLKSQQRRERIFGALAFFGCAGFFLVGSDWPLLACLLAAMGSFYFFWHAFGLMAKKESPTLGFLPAILCLVVSVYAWGNSGLRPLPWLFQPGPHIRLEGHYVPAERFEDGRTVTIGKAANNDLRLTESQIADELGMLRWTGGSDARLQYVHKATHRNALFKTRSGSERGAHRKVSSGEYVLYTELDGEPRDIASSVCSVLGAEDTSPPAEGSSEGIDWSQVGVLDGEALFFDSPSGSGDRALFFPASAGETAQLGTGLVGRTGTRQPSKGTNWFSACFLSLLFGPLFGGLLLGFWKGLSAVIDTFWADTDFSKRWDGWTKPVVASGTLLAVLLAFATIPASQLASVDDSGQTVFDVQGECKNLSPTETAACLKQFESINPHWWTGGGTLDEEQTSRLNLPLGFGATGENKLEWQRRIERDRYVQIGGARPQTVPGKYSAEPLVPGRFHVFRSRSEGIANAPWVTAVSEWMGLKGALQWSALRRSLSMVPKLGVSAGFAHSPATLSVGRAPDTPDKGRVFVLKRCGSSGDHHIEEVGVGSIADQDWLIAGSGVYYRAVLQNLDQPEPRVELMAGVAPKQAGVLSSLSFGRLHGKNRRVGVPACGSDSEDDLLLFEGETSSSFVRGMLAESVPKCKSSPGSWACEQAIIEQRTGGVASSGQLFSKTVSVPLPAWKSREISTIRENGNTKTNLATACVGAQDQLNLWRDDGTVKEDRKVEVVAPGDLFRLAGHTYRYQSTGPRLEQLLSIVSFIGIIGIILIWGLRWPSGLMPSRAPGGSSSGGVVFKSLYQRLREVEQPLESGQQKRTLFSGNEVVLLSVFLLFIVGAMLQNRLAVDDRLLGAADYLHRHLTTGVVAAYGFLVAFDMVVQWSSPRKMDRFLRHACVLVFILWLWAIWDWFWWRFGGPTDVSFVDPLLRKQLYLRWVKLTALGIALVLVRRHYTSIKSRIKRWFGVVLNGSAEPGKSRLWGPFKISAWVAPLYRFGTVFITLWQAVGSRVNRGAEGSQANWARRMLRLLFRPPSSGGEAKPQQGASRQINNGTNLLGLGVLVLCLGIPLSSIGGRSLGGFDFKIAEFAPIAIGAGFARLLAGFGVERGKALWLSGTRFAGIGHLFMAFRITSWVLSLFVLCLFTYGGRGDLGPLMVIIPALLCTMLVWVAPWRVGLYDGQGAGSLLSKDGKRTLGTRTVAWTFCFGAVVLAFRLSKAAVGFLNDWLVSLPVGGETIVRAVERFDTYGTPWFTETGQWTTNALWISAGYFGHGDPMHWLSNLHSDLAFIATYQVWGNLGNFMILLLFTVLAVAMLRLGDRLLHRAGWLYNECEKSDSDDFAGVGPFEKRRTLKRIHAATLEGAIAGYYLIFAGFYLASEIFVHVGTCFNTIPQTGVTIPWLSSGGSAALAFSILIGTSMAAQIKGRRELRRALGWIGGGK